MVERELLMSRDKSAAADKFFKAQSKETALSDYERKQKAQLENMARLKALRLAREAQEREAAAREAEAEAPQKRKPRPRPARAATA